MSKKKSPESVIDELFPVYGNIDQLQVVQDPPLDILDSPIPGHIDKTY